MQTLGVSVKQLRKKLLELGARILHVQKSKQRDMALVVRVNSVLSHFYSPRVVIFVHPVRVRVSCVSRVRASCPGDVLDDVRERIRRETRRPPPGAASGQSEILEESLLLFCSREASDSGSCFQSRDRARVSLGNLRESALKIEEILVRVFFTARLNTP